MDFLLGRDACDRCLLGKFISGEYLTTNLKSATDGMIPVYRLTCIGRLILGLIILNGSNYRRVMQRLTGSCWSTVLVWVCI
jgi:hypothetical protein